jgi:uridylate kinase
MGAFVTVKTVWCEERTPFLRYSRILLKLSGAAVAGHSEFGFDPTALNFIADEVLKLHQAGIEVGIVIGGGNIFRGNLGTQWGIEHAEADNIGMMATVINSLMLRGVLASRGSAEVRVMTAIPINTVAEPFIRLRAIHHMEKGYIVIFAAGTGQPFMTTDYPAVQRAIEVRAQALLAAKSGTDGIYTADPNRDISAQRFVCVNYDTVVRNNLRAMDQSAVILARDHNLRLHVFNFDQPGAMMRVCEGEDVGTLITNCSQDVLVADRGVPAVEQSPAQ